MFQISLEQTRFKMVRERSTQARIVVNKHRYVGKKRTGSDQTWLKILTKYEHHCTGMLVREGQVRISWVGKKSSTSLNIIVHHSSSHIGSSSRRTLFHIGCHRRSIERGCQSALLTHHQLFKSFYQRNLVWSVCIHYNLTSKFIFHILKARLVKLNIKSFLDSFVLTKNICSGGCSQHCSEFIRDPGEEGCWQ